MRDDDVNDSSETTPTNGLDSVDDGPTHVSDDPEPSPPGGAQVVTAPKLALPAYAEDPEDELAAGTQVGEYVIERKIGEGGMGSVYTAVHPLIGKKAAVKVIKRALGHDRGSVARFMQEARAVNQINHPNIVDVFSFGNLADGRCYFVMEWLPGVSLAQHLREGVLDWIETTHILEQTADALEAAHDKGIVHRDLKPENVCLVPVRGQRHQVKLLDFGIAKLKSPDFGMGTTQTGVVMGTPAYLSPEQARGKNVDHRTDIYALGCMGFELMTGELPFEAETAVDIIAAHLGSPVPHVRAHARGGDVPDALDDLLWRMLAKRADDRPTLSEVRAVCRELLADPERAQRTAPAISESSDTQPAIPLVTAEPPPRRRWPLVAGAAVLALAAGAYLMFARDAPPPPPVVAQPPSPPPVVVPQGTLAIRVNVPGARIEVDGALVAASAQEVRHAVGGGSDHTIAVSAPGHDAVAQTVRVAGGEVLDLPVTLSPLAAVTADEMARGMIEGGELATTDAAMLLGAGASEVAPKKSRRHRDREDKAPAEEPKPPEPEPVVVPEPVVEEPKPKPVPDKDYTLNPFEKKKPATTPSPPP